MEAPIEFDESNLPHYGKLTNPNMGKSKTFWSLETRSFSDRSRIAAVSFAQKGIPSPRFAPSLWNLYR
jgi:hypothetical protein